jgi:hypothetical protein
MAAATTPMKKRTCKRCGVTSSFLSAIWHGHDPDYCEACDKAHKEELAREEQARAREKEAKEEEAKFQAIEAIPKECLPGIDFDFIAAVFWETASTIAIDVIDNPLRLAGLSGGLTRFQVGIIAFTKDEVIQFRYGMFEGWDETVAKVVPGVIRATVQKYGNKPIITRVQRTTARIEIHQFRSLPLCYIAVHPESGGSFGGRFGKYYIDRMNLVCPRGHGLLKDWQGKKRCYTCGWPDK